MNKNQFIAKLEHSLQNLPITEREDIIEDFEEHFTIGMGEGKTEEEIAAMLGSPDMIARDLMLTYGSTGTETSETSSTLIRSTIVAISLIVFNAIFILGPAIALVAVVFAGWIVGVSFIASPLLVLTNGIIFPQTFLWFDLFFSLFLTGVGIFVAILMFYLSRWLLSKINKYVRYQVRLAKGGLTNAG